MKTAYILTSLWCLAIAGVLWINTSCITSKTTLGSTEMSGEVESLAPNNQTLKWVVKQVNIDSDDKPTTIFFSDPDHGWVATFKSLYRTSDSGKTWKKVTLPLSKEEEVVHVDFSNPEKGWLVSRSEAPSGFFDNQFRILTSFDSGDTWHENFAGKGIVFTSLIADGMRQTWLGGLRYTSTSPICFNPLFLTYDSEKQQWTSNDSIVEAIVLSRGAEKRNAKCLNTAVMGINLGLDNKVRLVTSEREIYEGNENLASWVKTHTIDIFDDQSAIRAFGTTTDSARPWFIEGTNSEEGTRGRLVLGSRNGSLIENKKGGHEFADAVYISNDEFLIGGSTIKYVSDKEIGRDVKINSAVIFQTVDGGKNLTEVFKSSDQGKIIRLFKIPYQQEVVWALSDFGNLLKLTRVNN